MLGCIGIGVIDGLGKSKEPLVPEAVKRGDGRDFSLAHCSSSSASRITVAANESLCGPMLMHQREEAHEIR